MSAILDKLYAERVQNWSDIQGHLEFMHDLVVAEDAKTVLELGVRDGNSTAALIAAVDKTDGHLWSVDVNPIPEVPAWVTSGRWTTLLGDDLTVVYSYNLPQQFDIVFIDTLHWFHHTLAELRLYAPKTNIVLLHDTELEHPWQQPAGEPAFPVREAIKHYVEVEVEAPDMAPTKKGPKRPGERTQRWQVEWRPGSYGMAVMRRR